MILIERVVYNRKKNKFFNIMGNRHIDTFHNPPREGEITKYFKGTDDISEITYFSNNKLHNTDGPAQTTYHENGHVKWEIWMENGQTHNYHGPAWLIFSEMGTILRRRWFIHNVEVTREEYITITDAIEN